MKTILYARVSREDLHCENQTKILKEWAVRNECADATLISEEMSTRKTRPLKNQLMLDFRSYNYDTVVVTRIDRFARSMQELVTDIHEIINNKGRFVSIQNGFDFQKNTFNSTQSLQLNIVSAFAEFEREMIRERTLEGLARVRAQGKKLGRPKGSKNKTYEVNRGGLSSENVEVQETDNSLEIKPTISEP